MPEKKDSKPLDKQKIVFAYTKSNYRVIGRHKHSAVKPCHWQEQKLLTGRANRNCYKGYFGIESHLCVQNTPALPFCNHQCVFCWRDIENGSLGSEWQGEVDDPKHLANEMIRHTKNLIFEHITLQRSLENLELMQKVLDYMLKTIIANSDWNTPFKETTVAAALNSTHNKIERAMLVLKSVEVLINPRDEDYRLHPRLHEKIMTENDIKQLIIDEVTTREEIEKVFEEAKHPRHAAISLAGEPTLYPRIGDLVAEFRKRGICTFIVTNGTNPDVIRNLQINHQLPTQLYMTLPAPNKKEYLKICRPMIRNGWERILETLSLLPSLECRTVVRITAVKHLNIKPEMVEEYADLLKNHTPHFIDIKGFTVEANALELKNRLKGPYDLRDYGPSFEDLMQFAKSLAEKGGFEIITSHEGSRDILLRGSWPKSKDIKIDFNHV